MLEYPVSGRSAVVGGEPMGFEAGQGMDGTKPSRVKYELDLKFGDEKEEATSGGSNDRS